MTSCQILETSKVNTCANSHEALVVSGLKQIIGLPGTKQAFTLHVPKRLAIPAGAFVGILGQTGCGKTTLLTVLGLLRGASSGSSLKEFSISLRGSSSPIDLTDIWKQNRSHKANRLRRVHFGFALQHGELLPSLTVAENIAFPLRINGWSRKRIRDRVDFLIEAFCLYRSFEEPANGQAGTNRLDKESLKKRNSSLVDARINHLSGGQYQRVALARAIAHQPEFLFVDEPTASLNRSVARIALQQMTNLRADDGTRSTIFMVTHDELFAKEFCDMIIQMQPMSQNGPLSEDAAGEVIFS